MKISIIETKQFSRDISFFLKRRSLLQEDFESLKRTLVKNPTMGDLIIGTGGVRKVRLKSSTKGKSGGYRVCFYYFQLKELLFLIAIYSKNDQENFSELDRKDFKEFTNEIKNT